MATITKETISPLHEKIKVRIEKADYLPAYEKSLKDYSKKANIPGFRPGKVPAGLVKKMYGPSVFMDTVLKAVDEKLMGYLQDEKLDIFAQPIPSDHTNMDQLNAGNPGDYDFDFEVGIKPDFQMPDLATMPVTAYNIDITDDMIATEMERLQNRYGNVADKEAVDNDEDIVNITFTETDENGNILENGITKDSSLLVKYFTENTRKELQGKKAGDTLNIRLGEAFGENEMEPVARELGLDATDAATKNKNFKLDITKVGVMEKKELGEEFYNQLYPNGDVKTEEEFKNKIKDDIFNYWAAQSRNQIHDQIFHGLTGQSNIDFPETFLKKWLTLQHAQPAEDGTPGKTPEQIEQEMPTFLNQLKWSLVTNKIVADNNIAVSQDDLKNFTRQQLYQYMGGTMQDADDQPWMADYINKMMKDRKYVEDAYNRLQTEKVFEWAEKQVRPASQQISADDFAKMAAAHQH